MTGPRVLLVSRRYWPCCDDSVHRLMLLGEGLRRSGAGVTVLTSRQNNAWSERMVHREIPIERPFDAPRSIWSVPRYTKSLTHWLEPHASDFDAIYVDSMRDDAAVVIKTLAGHGPPVIVRCGGNGDQSDTVWWQNSRAGMKSLRAIFAANAFIASRPSTMQQMIAQGVPSARIHRIDDGFPTAKRTTVTERRAARRALASVSQELRLDDDAQIVLIPMRLTHTKYLHQMLDSLTELLRQWPTLHFWVTGNKVLGNHVAHNRLENEVRCRSLVGDVISLGSFDHLEEIVDAANIVVATADGDSLEGLLPTALSRGIPILLGQHPDLRFMLGVNGELSQWFNADRQDDLAESLRQTLTFYDSATRNAEQLRQRIALSGSQQTWVEAHFRLIRQLANCEVEPLSNRLGARS